MNANKLRTLFVAAMLLVAAGGTVAMGATAAAAGNDLAVDVTQSAPGENATVTVTSNGTAVDNASVEVVALDNVTYAGEGNYTTDVNGTVGLPAPEQNVSVEVTATYDNTSANTTAELLAAENETSTLAVNVTQPEAGDEATVTVTSNGTAVDNASVEVVALDNVTYAGEGNYTTDANGTVTLPAPEQNVSVEVTAVYDNETANTTAELLAEQQAFENESLQFGQRVSALVHFLKSQGAMGGQNVSEWVTEHNPGKADEHRPEHAGPKDDSEGANASSDDDHGEPDHAGNGHGNADENANDDHGKSAHADDDETDSEDENDDAGGHDDSGSPGHSGGHGNSGGHGHGHGH